MKRKGLSLVLALVLALGLCACGGGSKEVQAVVDAIDAIGTVAEGSWDDIVVAQDLYYNLSEEDRESVSNFDDLVYAVATYADCLQDEVSYLEDAMRSLTDDVSDKDYDSAYETASDLCDRLEGLSSMSYLYLNDKYAEPLGTDDLLTYFEEIERNLRLMS